MRPTGTVIAIVMVAAIAACGGGGEEGDTNQDPTAGLRQDVEQFYAILFEGEEDPSQLRNYIPAECREQLALVEGFRNVLAFASADVDLAVEIRDVEFLDADRALVETTVLLDGDPLLNTPQTYYIRQDGHWRHGECLDESLRITPSEQAAPSAQHTVVFVADLDGDRWEIYAVNSDGSDLRRITDSPGQDVEPVRSPDGARIAFVSARSGRRHVYVMNADGSEVTRLSTGTDNVAYPAWSPDGEYVAWISGDESGGNLNGVLVARIDGSEPTQFAGQYDPLREPSPGTASFSWSPDSRRLVYSHSLTEEIHVVDVAGSESTRILHGDSPSWSLGNRIAYQARREGNEDIYVANADGSDETRLTSDPATDRYPAWSSDERRILFTSSRAGPASSELYVMNADGTGQTRVEQSVTVSGESCWAPDGERIFFLVRSGSLSEIQVARADGTGAARVLALRAIIAAIAC